LLQFLFQKKSYTQLDDVSLWWSGETQRTGASLVFHWCFTGVSLGLHWGFTGASLVLTGASLGPHWGFTGASQTHVCVHSESAVCRWMSFLQSRSTAKVQFI
jgi:flagellar biosynthesis protein FliR